MQRLSITVSALPGEAGGLAALEGRVDLYNFQELGRELKAAAAEHGLLVVDLERVTYIASSGWAVLMAQARILKAQQKRFIVVGMTLDVKRVYDVMCVKDPLPSAPSLDAALKMLASGAA